MGIGRNSVLAGALFALVPFAARATAIVLAGSGSMAPSYQFEGSAGGPVQTSASSGNLYALGLPGTYTFQDTLGVDSYPVATPPVGVGNGTYDFQDSFEFSITAPAKGDALVVSLPLPGSFSISDLQFRLYQLGSGSMPQFGNPLPAGSTPVVAWMPGNASTTFTNIASGNYVLEVAGIAGDPITAPDGGTYVGQLQVAPVPLPATMPLLFSALGGFVFTLRRRETREPRRDTSQYAATIL